MTTRGAALVLTVAALSPAGHVTRAAQGRAYARGVRGADTSVRFSACPAGQEPGRTGWPGGLVVDRPRCVTLVVKVSGASAVRRRVSLGRPC